MQDRWRFERASLRPSWAATAVGAALLFAVQPARADQDRGLRWVGDARVGASAQGTFVGGPALRFRYGWRLTQVKHVDEDEDGEEDLEVKDLVLGSFFGGELSSGLLVGESEPNAFGALTQVALRPWLSRNQTAWFLRTERWSLAGLVLPEVGVTFGTRQGARLHLGWDLPLGPRAFQFVPGVLWFPAGRPQPLLFTLAFRVPM